MNKTLHENIDRFINEGHITPDEIYLLILERKDEFSLSQALRLAASDYGGNTYKWELKSSALFLVLNWGRDGIYKLRDLISENPSHPNISLTSRFLAHIAAAKLELFPFMLKGKAREIISPSSKKWKDINIRVAAQTVLVDIVNEFEKDVGLPPSLLGALSNTYDEDVSDQIFSSLVMRWFNFNKLSIEDYLKLIQDDKLDEIHYQNFLKRNPYLIEPFHSKFWSKPRFGEGLQPDFLFRLMDNSYVVVEIEKPWLPILTKDGNLSSYATHAKRQALEYREWAISNQLYAQKRFPKIWRPFSLVIIGLEKNLSEKQVDRLRQENESTQGVLKIVGFDWIYDRSKATFENLIKYGFGR